MKGLFFFNAQGPRNIFLLSIMLILLACSEQPKTVETNITAADLKLARSVISANTMTIPGYAIGTWTKVGPGDLSSADTLVLYLLKYHQASNICPPVEVVSQILQKLSAPRFAKKAVAVFWLEYSASSDLDTMVSKQSFLKDSFDWYINTKTTEKLKISNAKMEGFIGAGEAWQKATAGQRKFWEKSRAREDEYYLTRDNSRLVINAEAAVSAAERAIASGY